MRTEAQLRASRANGAKSHGPKTPTGKHNSSRNAITHGLLAETVVLEGECTERFFAVIAELEEEYEPRTATEQILVENMAIARWHKLRVVGFNKALLDHETRRRAESLEASEKFAASAATDSASFPTKHAPASSSIATAPVTTTNSSAPRAACSRCGTAAPHPPLRRL